MSDIFTMLLQIDAGCEALGLTPEDFKAMSAVGQYRVIEAGRQELEMKETQA